MYSFLFWNIANSCSSDVVSDVSIHTSADFLILAENCLDTNAFLKNINSKSHNQYKFCVKNERKLTIFSTLLYTEFRVIKTQSRYLLALEIIKNNTKIILFALHLPSKLRTDDSDRRFISRKVIAEINTIEDECGHKNSLVVGDFNMNPFEDGMVEVDAFNSVMSSDIANKRSRKVHTKEYTYFYNPMWGHFGDISNSPSGTYFYNSSDYKNKYHWNIFDQVLIRPNIIRIFDVNSLSILDCYFNKGKKEILLSKGRSIKVQLSDHLPLNFWLKI